MKNFEREHSYICIFTSKEIKGEKLLFYSSTAFSGRGVGKPLLGIQRAVSPTNFCIEPKLFFTMGNGKGVIAYEISNVHKKLLRDHCSCEHIARELFSNALSHRLFHSANRSSSVITLVNTPLYSFCVRPYVVMSVLRIVILGLTLPIRSSCLPSSGR